MELRRYQNANLQEPFSGWLEAAEDKLAQARIHVRLRQLEAGNFGDTKSVGNGVIELRVHVGAGYRLYCDRHGSFAVLLLCGGDKRTQGKDLKLAKTFWIDWTRRQS